MFKSKIKTTIIGGVIVGAVVFAVSAFGVGFSSTNNVSYSITAKATDALPSDFKTQDNINAKKSKLGIDQTNEQNTDLKVNFKFEPIENDPDQLNVSGNGVMKVGDDVYPFTISNISRLKQAKLSNGNTLIWGPIDATLKNKMGKDDQMVLGLAYIPETNQNFSTLTVGTMDSGLAALTFGTDFSTDEMRKIVENWEN